MARKKKAVREQFAVTTFEFDGQFYGNVAVGEVNDGTDRVTRDGYPDEESARFAGCDLANRMMSANKEV